MRQAERLITQHFEKLEQLAGALLRNEKLERDDIDRIMAGVERIQRPAAPGLRVVAASTETEAGPGLM